ncbi:hypothetical protein IAU60_004305 [Kwoniella sp. DSM 27419]
MPMRTTDQSTRESTSAGRSGTTSRASCPPRRRVDSMMTDTDPNAGAEGTKRYPGFAMYGDQFSAKDPPSFWANPKALPLKGQIQRPDLTQSTSSERVDPGACETTEDQGESLFATSGDDVVGE